MRIFIGGKWREGFADYHRRPNEYRIEVLAWRNLERLSGLYFVRPKSPWLVWNYLWDVGPQQTARKIISRFQERLRNEKYVACGIGRLCEIPETSALGRGQTVLFVAPCHPTLPERLVLPKEFLRLIEPGEFEFLSEECLYYRESLVDAAPRDAADVSGADTCWWQPVRGWNPYAGIKVPLATRTHVLDRARDCLKSTDWAQAIRLSNAHAEPVAEHVRACSRSPRQDRKNAVLFGYGNYAKGIILPNVRRYLDVQRIHEIDPLQIPVHSRAASTWSTTPLPCDGNRYDAYLIASFHHLHAPLAIHALQQDVSAVVEKPIAVDHDQVTSLVAAMGRSRGKIFCCFHKRYLPFNAWVPVDLRTNPGEPIDYHCVVYEAPLPALHWYRWPNSKSRLITNGCHWIDHFLFLNGYCEPASVGLTVGPGRRVINCSIALANGAFFTMVMTYAGSERIGPQDYVELRANGRTVRMINESVYLAEAGHRLLRRHRMSKMQSYNLMYREISRRIAHGDAGDSPAAVTGAVELGLALEDRWKAATDSAVNVTLAAPQTLAEPEKDLQVLDATKPLGEAEFDALASHGERVRRHAGHFS
jgi:predicted dehydrogenase